MGGKGNFYPLPVRWGSSKLPIEQALNNILRVRAMLTLTLTYLLLSLASISKLF